MCPGYMQWHDTPGLPGATGKAHGNGVRQGNAVVSNLSPA